MVESLAQERGLIATFMPKPFSHLTGNGCHFHMSLWKDGENAFEADPSDDPRGMGLSPLAYNFIGGLKAHAKAYIAVTAPTVGSYKRLVVGTRSGSSWAPVYVSLRLQQPHPDAAHPGRGPRRGPHRRRLVQPVPGRGRGAGRRARRDRARARPGRADHGAQPPRADRRPARGARRRAAARRPCWTPRASSRSATCCARRSATPGARTTWTTSCGSSAQEFQEWHDQVSEWEVDRYLQLF